MDQPLPRQILLDGTNRNTIKPNSHLEYECIPFCHIKWDVPSLQHQDLYQIFCSEHIKHSLVDTIEAYVSSQEKNRAIEKSSSLISS